ncbi:hypothetical protein OESDEN_25307 [Oesophagostomum dentatum]|uniref:CWH43-like N-terminal domain-containing protein n=1 Tax=Oesophagostomum dentatum TaxID=61180 RepID=A0A0B1RVA6_OESDE|nr:hypothetical protein OESDEN_25307 [Oesophagostomum dentatum]
MIIVANFRYVEHFAAHMVGALLTFFAMLPYAWGQVVISYVLVPGMATPAVNSIRLFAVTLATCFLTLHELAAFTRVFIPKDAGEFPGWDDPSWRKSDSPFHTTYMVATSCEWGMTLVMQLFVLTFAAELRSTYAYAPRVVFKQDTDESAALNDQPDD